MTLTGKKMLIQQAKTATTTEGGLVLPEQTVTTLPKGVVIHQAEGCVLTGIGDTILFNQLGGIPVQVSGVDYLLIEDADVLVILDEGEF
jgi:co-chaperonin GroES (HSP10)